MSFAARRLLLLNKSRGGAAAPLFTNWWQGIGDVVPLSDAYTIYDPLSAADLAASYTNLANPGTKDAVPGVAPTHAQNSGWSFNGTTQYLSSQTNFLATSTIIIWFEDVAGIYIDGGVKCIIRPINGLTGRYTIGTNTDIQGETLGGVIAIRPGMGLYKNRTKYANMGAWVSGANSPVFIAAQNNGVGPQSFASGRVLRRAHYNFLLSDAEVEAVISAMLSYQLPADDPYSTIVLSTNPVCYYTCNHKHGSVLFDKSGNGADSDCRALLIGQPGLKGLAIRGVGLLNNHTKSYGDWAGQTGLNLNEFSAGGWFNITSDAANQIRLFNLYSSTVTEYAALEVRVGLTIAMYLKENGVLQDSDADVVTLTNETWHHIVYYNSLSGGVFGFYIDGVKHEYTRTLGGFNDTSPDFGFPQCLSDGLVSAQHMAYWDHALTQGEVNTLNV